MDHSAKTSAPGSTAIIDSHDAIVNKTLAGVITSRQSAAERIFGYPADERRPAHHVHDPSGAPGGADVVLAQIVRGEKVDHFETVRLAKDWRLVDISSYRYRWSGQGRPDHRRLEDRSRHHRVPRPKASAMPCSRPRPGGTRGRREALNRGRNEFATLSDELRMPLTSFSWVGCSRTVSSAQTRRQRGGSTEKRDGPGAAHRRLVRRVPDHHREHAPRSAPGRSTRGGGGRSRCGASRNQREGHPPGTPRSTREPVRSWACPIASSKSYPWNLLINAVHTERLAESRRIRVRLRRAHRQGARRRNRSRGALHSTASVKVNAGTKSPTRGLGIGSALARYLVDLHGGSIRRSPGIGRCDVHRHVAHPACPAGAEPTRAAATGRRAAGRPRGMASLARHQDPGRG